MRKYGVGLWCGWRSEVEASVDRYFGGLSGLLSLWLGEGVELVLPLWHGPRQEGGIGDDACRSEVA